MDKERLVEFLSKELHFLNDIKHEITKLLGDYSEEKIYFAAFYCKRFYLSELKGWGLKKTFAAKQEEIELHYALAKVKKARKRQQEREAIYAESSKNHKRVNKPCWFRKSFDKHLFE